MAGGMASITTLSFNIQWGKVWDEDDPDGAPIRLDKTIEEIRRHDADIIMLQEVEAVAGRVLLIHAGKLVFDGTPEALRQKGDGNMDNAFHTLTDASITEVA